MLILSRLIDAIPPLPTSVMQLGALQADPNRSIKDIAQIVEADPVLSAKILSLVNAPLYGLRNEITSVSHACAQLGETAIYSMAVLMGLHNTFKFDLEPYGLSEREFLYNTMMQTHLMNEWVRNARPSYANELRLAAFLSDIGKILIAKLLKDYDKVDEFQAKLKEGITEPNAELSVIGMTTVEVTAYILEHWKVNQNVVDILRYTRGGVGAPDGLKIPIAMMESVHHLWHLWRRGESLIRQEALMGFVLYESEEYAKYELAVNNVLTRLKELRA